MTAAVSRGTASLAVPQTQNSAPVHSFRCLYTYDVRRKQKRWHDGLLKFHTFNKRVMVYDDASNFIGDTHYKEGKELLAGDEVHLDEGIMVDVGDRVGTSQTNLAPLFERERKITEEPVARSSSPIRLQTGRNMDGPQAAQKKHRSLNALLGAPRGTYGRATLPQSPYDARHSEVENEWQDGTSAKRRKTGKGESQAQQWSITGVQTVGKGTPLREAPSWARTTDSRGTAVTETKGRTTSSWQRSLMVKEVIDISSDDEGFLLEHEQLATSDVTLPWSPPIRAGASKTVGAPSPRPGIQLDGRNRPAAKPGPTRPPKPSSPPVSTKSRMKNVQSHFEDEQTQHEASSPVRPKPLYRALRLAKSQRRPMLMCQLVHTAAQIPPQASTPGTHQDPIELSDSEDHVVPKSVAKSRKKTSQTPLTRDRGETGAFPRRATLLSDGIREARTSSPAFSTMVPRAEHFEAPSVPFDTTRDSGDTITASKSKQRKRLSNMHYEEMAMAQGVLDQRLLSASVASPTSGEILKTTVNGKAAKSAQNRPFRRVHSGSDIPVPTTHLDNFDTLPIIQEDSIPPAKIKPTRKEREKAPKTLPQRSSSLTNIAPKRNSKAPPIIARRVDNQEIGAWTVEAMDLFDWRPPNWDARGKERKQLQGQR